MQFIQWYIILMYICHYWLFKLFIFLEQINNNSHWIYQWIGPLTLNVNMVDRIWLVVCVMNNKIDSGSKHWMNRLHQRAPQWNYIIHIRQLSIVWNVKFYISEYVCRSNQQHKRTQ